MAANSRRIVELRRRVQADPASVAFAALAEECRRAGAVHEAISVCRAGLGYHPGDLSARVTLGRALIEVGRLDEAEAELSKVVRSVPTDSLAVRGLADVHLAQALAHYKQAAHLARHDQILKHFLDRLAQLVASAPTRSSRAPVAEDILDFDSLLTRPVTIAPMDDWGQAPKNTIFQSPDRDGFARVDPPATPGPVGLLAELESWIASIVTDRRASGIA